MTQKRLHELVRVSYVKASEYQRRGLVHLHALIRLDRRMPDYRNGEIRPPDKRFTSELLEQALRKTAKEVKVKIPDELGAGDDPWGKQLDVQQLPADDKTAGAGRAIWRSTRPRAPNRPAACYTASPVMRSTTSASEHNRRYLTPRLIWTTG